MVYNGNRELQTKKLETKNWNPCRDSYCCFEGRAPKQRHGRRRGHGRDTPTREQTWTPRSRGESKQPVTLSPVLDTLRRLRVPTSQSDAESVASPTAALKRDLEGVEAQLLADRRTRVEAGLLRGDVLAQAAAPSTAWHLRRRRGVVQP